MVNPRTPTRDLIAKVFKDQRTIIAVEQLFKTVQTDLTPILVLLQDVQIESGSANARAQQAIDTILADKIFGEFFSTIDQSALAVDTAKAVIFNNTRVANGVSVSGSQITVDRTGVYKIECVIQL